MSTKLISTKRGLVFEGTCCWNVVTERARDSATPHRYIKISAPITIIMLRGIQIVLPPRSSSDKAVSPHRGQAKPYNIRVWNTDVLADQIFDSGMQPDGFADGFNLCLDRQDRLAGIAKGLQSKDREAKRHGPYNFWAQ